MSKRENARARRRNGRGAYINGRRPRKSKKLNKMPQKSHKKAPKKEAIDLQNASTEANLVVHLQDRRDRSVSQDLLNVYRLRIERKNYALYYH